MKTTASQDMTTALRRGGEVGSLMAACDWSKTSLGQIDTWPQSLKTTVSLLLMSRVPLVLLWGEDGVMLYNDAYSMFAADRHPQSLGSKVRDTWPEIADFNASVIKAGLAGETLSYRDQELTLHRKGTPEQAWMDLDYTPVLGEDGRYAGVLVIVVETTEQVVARRALQASEEKFRVFAQAIPNHVWACRPDGYIDWFNAQVYAYTGEAPGALDGLDTWSRRLHPDDMAAATAAWARSLASGEVYQTEFRIRGADGQYRWFLVRAEPVRDADGRITRWVGNNTDIDDARRQSMELARLNHGLEAEIAVRTGELMAAEEQLRQAQKMEAVGQLTGGIAHDFNNLLTGVTGSLELMRARIAQGRFDMVERYIHAADGAAKRAAMLTQRLLAFSRRQTLDPKPTDLNRLVAGMEEILRRTVGPSIHIEVVGAGGLWTTLIDAAQLDNALLNLCINARDAMPEGGRITIETANKWLDDRGAAERDLPPGQYVSLCVTDTGTGMAPDVISRAFDPFFTTKPIGSGTGLGLSMIYGFVRQSGGQVRIYSEPGQGTTMCLYLPRHAGLGRNDVVAEDAVLATSARDGETILVVDDEPTVRMFVTEILEDAGYVAIEAIDGTTGAKVLESDIRIDLLVTDVGLPGGMNGRQLADVGRTLRPGLKVLFITGYAENAAVGNGHLESGMQVVTKPFAMDAFAAKIHEMMKSEPSAEPRLTRTDASRS